MNREARCLASLALLASIMLARSASAYPHFQLSSETASCNQCHHAPAGGGLLTGWGREESADTLSRGGEGDFLHGVVSLPSWLDMGGDFRLAALANETGADSGAEYAAFPMQADVAARFAAGAWSLTASLGLRGVVRPGTPDQAGSGLGEVELPGPESYLVSREHYLSWQSTAGAYVRAGRFFAPYGLRLVDHTTYVRRHLGFNQLEESYGISAGIVAPQWEAHVTGFASDRLREATRREIGVAGLVEYKASTAVAGASARLGVGEEDVRTSVGIHAKWWMAGPQLLWQLELDGVRQDFDAGPGRWQLVGYAGPTWTPAQGLYIGASYEIFDEDIIVRDVERHGVGAWLSFLPRAHMELMLSGRTQRIGASDHAHTGLVQLHYYL